MAKSEPKVINARRDANGKVELMLYSRKFDVTELVKDGVANAKLLGERYEIHIEGEYKTESQKTPKAVSESQRRRHAAIRAAKEHKSE